MDIVTKPLEWIEGGLDNMGLMRGGAAVPKRMVLGALIGAFIVTNLKPDSMFEDGMARPWNLIASEDDPISPTTTPWWFSALFGALILGVFI